jgi:hypothetical protein
MNKYTVRAIAPCLYHIEDAQGRVVATTQCPDMADTIDYALNYDDNKCHDALSEIMGITEVDVSVESDADKLNEILLEISTIANYALMESV